MNIDDLNEFISNIDVEDICISHHNIRVFFNDGVLFYTEYDFYYKSDCICKYDYLINAFFSGGVKFKCIELNKVIISTNYGELEFINNDQPYGDTYMTHKEKDLFSLHTTRLY